MKRRTSEDRIVDSVNYFLLILISIVTLYPFYYIIIISLNEGKDTIMGGVYLWPREFTLDNYIFFFKDPQWIKAFFVSVVRTVIGTLLGVLFTTMVAYGLAKRDLLFKKFYFLVIIIAMNFSGGLITYYVVLRGLGLLNTFGVYIIPTMLNIFFVLVAVSFFREIPAELGESARMDGANELQIFGKIILPLSKPLLATMSLFVGTGHWNSWLDSAYFVQDENLRTLAYRMIQVINQAMISTDTQAAQFTASLTVTQFSVQVTAMVIAIAPIICIYPFLQKHFVKGIMLGSVKG